MAAKTVVLRRNKDDTVTVRVGRAVEHIDTTTKTHAQVFDAVKYAILSKDVHLTDIEIVELMNEG